MANKALTGSIALTRLPQVAIIEKKGKNGIVRGVFLPIQGNNLTEKDGSVYMDVRCVIREEIDQYGQNGFIAKSLPTEVYKENKDNEQWMKDNQPILGNLKDWSNTSEPSAPVLNDEDDLPF